MISARAAAWAGIILMIAGISCGAMWWNITPARLLCVGLIAAGAGLFMRAGGAEAL